MAVKIRLARAGTKKRPYYHIVVADRGLAARRQVHRRGRRLQPDARQNDEERVKLDGEKAAEWLKKGAQPTDRVLRFLDKAGIKKRDARNNPKKALPGKKRLEREKLQADAAAKAAAAAAAAAAAPAEAPAAEAPQA